MLAHPTKAMLDEMIESGLFRTLTGMETNSRNIVLGFCFNFIFSNGQLTQQRDEYKSYFNHIMPEDVPEKIKSVNIYYTGFINGFHFFDKDGVLIWQIGATGSDWIKKTVLLEDDEVIIGVICKLLQGYQGCYTDFQFQIASRSE